MRKHTIGMFLALSTVTVFGTALHAQSYELAATVPFAFQVGTQTFAPGDYKVMKGSQGVPTLRNVATKRSLFIAGASATLGSKEAAKLVFHCYNGETCFLTEIWRGTGYGISVPTSKAEKALINGEGPREMAKLAVDLHPTE